MKFLTEFLTLKNEIKALEIELAALSKNQENANKLKLMLFNVGSYLTDLNKNLAKHSFFRSKKSKVIIPKRKAYCKIDLRLTREFWNGGPKLRMN